jgi:transposase-like protein
VLRPRRSGGGSSGRTETAAACDGGLTTGEREELNRLLRENRKLRVERDILSKAAAWFANENLGTPKRSSIDPHQGVRFIRS